MPTNDFKQLASGVGANVATQAAYATAAQILAGFSSGIVPSDVFNKVLRQSSGMAAMIGMFINTMGGVDALDDTNLATLAANFERAIARSAIPATILTASTVLTAQNTAGSVMFNSTTLLTHTLPAANSFNQGERVEFVNLNTGLQFVQGAGVDTILAGPSSFTSLSLTAGDVMVLESDGNSKWYVTGGNVQARQAKSAFHAIRTGGSTTQQSISSQTATKIIFTNELYDDLGEYNPATSQFTARSTGLYQFSAGVYTTTSNAGRYLSLFVNGTEKQRLYEIVLSGGIVTYGDICGHTGGLQLNAGDVVEIRVTLDAASLVGATSDALTYFSGQRIK